MTYKSSRRWRCPQYSDASKTARFFLYVIVKVASLGAYRTLNVFEAFSVNSPVGYLVIVVVRAVRYLRFGEKQGLIA